MQISSKSRYGMRALIELGLCYEKELVTAKTIAKKRNISTKYLEQILSMLKGFEIIKTLRGPHGGCSLSKPPGEIKLSTLFTALELPEDSSECPEHKSFTNGCSYCVVHAVFAKLINERTCILDSITIQDMLDLHEGTKKDI
jgi:Rrf2 family protein